MVSSNFIIVTTVFLLFLCFEIGEADNNSAQTKLDFEEEEVFYKCYLKAC